MAKASEAPKGPKNKKLSVAQRRMRVAELYLTGHTQVQIAADVDVNQATVSRDLKAVRREWQESTLFNFDAALGRELARIDEVERHAWQGWFRSVGEAKTTVSDEKTAGKGKEKTSESRKRVTLTHQAGDPRFLSQVAWCVEQRAKMLGLNKPVEVDVRNFAFTSDEAAKARERLEGWDTGIGQWEPGQGMVGGKPAEA